MRGVIKMLRNKNQKYYAFAAILVALMFTAFAIAPAIATNSVFSISNETQQQSVSYNSKINDYGAFSEWAVSINVSDLVSLEYSTLISTYENVDIVPILNFLSENVYINEKQHISA